MTSVLQDWPERLTRKIDPKDWLNSLAKEGRESFQFKLFLNRSALLKNGRRDCVVVSDLSAADVNLLSGEVGSLL